MSKATKVSKKEDKKRRYYHPKKKDNHQEDDLFLVEATKTINQKKADSVSILKECDKLVFLDSDSINFKVYEEEDGTTVVTMNQIKV